MMPQRGRQPCDKIMLGERAETGADGQQFQYGAIELPRRKRATA